MLSNKVIDYLNKQGVYSEKEDKAYKKALIDLGIDLSSDFAFFCLHTTETSFKGRVGSIGEFYQFNLSSCIRQQNSLTAQFVSFSLLNLANIFYPPPNFYNN